MFEHPIEIQSETAYTAHVLYEGSSEIYFGKLGKTSVSVKSPNDEDCSTITFKFSKAQFRGGVQDNGTNVSGGQIPEILFFVK